MAARPKTSAPALDPELIEQIAAAVAQRLADEQSTAELRAYTIPATADMLSTSVRTVHRMIAAEQLDVIRFSARSTRVTGASIARVLREGVDADALLRARDYIRAA